MGHSDPGKGSENVISLGMEHSDPGKGSENAVSLGMEHSDPGKGSENAVSAWITQMHASRILCSISSVPR